MALMRISQYIDKYYEEGSKPNPRAIVGMIERGELYGEKRGIWYVDPEVPTISKREMMEIIPVPEPDKPVSEYGAKLISGMQ